MKEAIIGENRLINGDCLEMMDKLIEEGVVFDAVITDPPLSRLSQNIMI